MEKNKKEVTTTEKKGFKGKNIAIIASILTIAVVITLAVTGTFEKVAITGKEQFLGSSITTVVVYKDLEDKTTLELPRGTVVTAYGTKKVDDVTYTKIKYDIDGKSNEGYVLKENLVDQINQAAFEKEVFVRTATHLYKAKGESQLVTLVDKGSKLTVSDCEMDNDGSCKWYKASNGKEEGYVRGKYMVFTENDSKLNYDPKGYFTENNLTYLDFYPRLKPKFENNKRPDEVRALFLTTLNVSKVDDFIKLAKETNINSFVVDIKETDFLSYQSPVAKEYTKTGYDTATRSLEKYKEAMQKLKDNGFYIIGRIVVFKDSIYANDNLESAIIDKTTGKPYLRGQEIFVSAYDRKVWEYNIELAKEAVNEFKFNEIQFDYIRFIDRTQTLDAQNLLDYHNDYKEDKAQAIQRFAMYATDEMHELGVYVSGDVFGETAMMKRATAYGQQWQALSNVFDVISPMPYPDHFAMDNFGLHIPWLEPYELQYRYHTNVVKFQETTPTPAIVTSWIQTYDAKYRTPKKQYTAKEVSEQIQGIYDTGLTGYLTWNSEGNLEKYSTRIDAFKKEYKNNK